MEMSTARKQWAVRASVAGAAFAYAAALVLWAGGGVRAEEDYPFRVSIDHMVELDCFDCDGVALGDINQNGRTDILMSTGDDGETIWYAQGETPWEWTRHHIHTIDYTPREIEGNALADFDGDGQYEAVSLEQPQGNIYVFKHGGDPTGEWGAAIIQPDRPYVQDAMVTDITGDGTPDLVYTWEGVEEGMGGVHWLEFTGDDVLNPDHWTDHIMTVHESGWWMAPERADLNGNGRATDIVYTARHLTGRNPASRPGLFWLEEPEDVRGEWTSHRIDNTLPHPLHVAWGDFSGDGHGRDLVVGGFHTDTVYWYEKSRNWARHAIRLPETLNNATTDRVWNVKGVPLGGERDYIFVAATGQDERRGAFLMLEFIDGAYRVNNLKDIGYTHPTDDHIMVYDLDGDGQPELLMPDSGPGQDRFIIMKLAVGNGG